jgi:hypothetical protein
VTLDLITRPLTNFRSGRSREHHRLLATIAGGERTIGQLIARQIGDMPQHLEWVFGAGKREVILRRGEPVQNIDAARARLTNEQRTALLDFLRTVLKRQIEEHPTLRRAVALTQAERLELMFFRDASPSGSDEAR